MKLNLNIFSFTCIIICISLQEVAFSQTALTCINLYSSNSVLAIGTYPTLEKLRTPDLLKLEKKISELQNNINEVSAKKFRLENSLKEGVTIPYYLKPDALIKNESKLRVESADLENELSELPKLEQELIRAEAFLSGKSLPEESEEIIGLLKKYYWGPKAKKNKTKWTAGEIEELKRKIELYEKNIAIRKNNIQIYLKRIAKISQPYIERMKDKTNEELEVEKQKLIPLFSEINSLKSERDLILFEKQKEALVVFNGAMRDKRLNSPITDLLSTASLRKIPTSNKITLLIGNNLNHDNFSEKQLNEIKELISSLISKKYYIVYDAESIYSKEIELLTGEYGIPVMSKQMESFSENKNKVIINNDYLRMKLLSESASVITTPDSITGIGLYLEGLASHMLDVNGVFENGTLWNWAQDLKNRNRDLGATAKNIKIFSNTQSLISNTGYFDRNIMQNSVSNFQKFSIIQPDQYSLDSLQKILEEAVSVAKVNDQNHDTGGSVIFGSSKEDKNSANLIYQSAYILGRLGIAVATGGAGGAMEIANTGAWNAGGDSIGIPIGGKHTLDSERTFASSKHTKTIVTSGYEERIPALLGDGIDSRKLIIFAPGGNGTIKELATTLVRASSKLLSFKYIVFLDSDYYSSLVNWLMKSNLPKELKDKIVTINSADELEQLAKPIQETFERNRISEPRVEQLEYITKPTYSTNPWLSGKNKGFKNQRIGSESVNSTKSMKESNVENADESDFDIWD